MNSTEFEYVSDEVSVFVPAAAVILTPPFSKFDEPLRTAVVQLFVDAFLKGKNLPSVPYMAYIDKWSDYRQPWPIFLCEDVYCGDVVAEFYPKDFVSQTRPT